MPGLAFTRPMAGLAIAQVLGIACAFLLPGSVIPFVFLTFILLFAVLVLARAAPSVLGMPLLFAAGWISLLPWMHSAFPANHIIHFLDTGPAKITATICERPEQYLHRTQLILDVDRIGDENPSGPIIGKIRLTVSPPVRDLAQGSKVRFVSEIRSLRNFANPGGFDYVQFMRFREIFGAAYMRGQNGLKILGARTGAFFHTRKSLSELIKNSAPPETRALFFALLLGEKWSIDQETRDLFARTGIAHVLAISGLHIGMVALFAFQVFRLILSRSRKVLLSGRLFSLCAILTMGPVLLYGFLTGMAPSTQRAVIMVSVFLLGYVFDRDYDSLNTLAVAAMVILVWHPPALFDVGFQLSFTAVFSILYGLKIVSFKTIPITWGEKARRKALVYLLIPLIAALGTAPVVLHYFDQVSLVGPLANLLVVPLVGFIILPVSLMACLGLPVLPGVSGLMITMAGFMLQGVLGLAQMLASIPYASIMPIKPNAPEILLYYLALLSILHIKKRWAQCLLILCLIGSGVDAGYWINQRFGNADLRVTFLDVGQGSSALVEFPHGPCMLVDGGGLSATSTFDTGRMIVAPFLWQRKIHTIDYLVLTHPQHDHAGGLGYLAEKFRIKEFWSNGQPAPIHAYEHLMAACSRKRALLPSLEDLHKPQDIQGVTARVLHPAPGFEAMLGKDLQLNENSLVLKLSFGSQSVMFTGDIEAEGEALLVNRWNPEALQTTLCAAPHHGSQTSSTDEFVNAIKPEHVVFATGARNWYGFPNESVVLRYLTAGAQVYDTGKQGACAFSTKGDAWTVKVFQEE
ncbi:MAG: DNA internalization-related competence protein ComEC/Rec2 [Desulfatibacillum sp.]|nr:DNA internalization-related competence protein ComEC/Rec2 [Desulfatibacillum sp.]